VTYLSDGQAVLEVDVLSLDVASDLSILRSLTSDLEGDVGRSKGLDLEGGSLDRIVLLEEVTGRLAEVLNNQRMSAQGVTDEAPSPRGPVIDTRDVEESVVMIERIDILAKMEERVET
jgi:hypothetical protein